MLRNTVYIDFTHKNVSVMKGKHRVSVAFRCHLSPISVCHSFVDFGLRSALMRATVSLPVTQLSLVT